MYSPSQICNPGNVTVIIREAGERTAPLCRALVESMFGQGTVTVVSEVPFVKALRSTYEIAIEISAPWTLVIDADVLIEQSGIEYLLRVAECVDSTIFALQGLVCDKLADGPRMAGNRLYRTACLRQALEEIPPALSVARPESHTIRTMRKRGLYNLVLDRVVGLHDYEQFFRDIYRKAFFHAQKHEGDIVYWERMWRDCCESEQDYKVAMKGAVDGRDYSGEVISDIRQFESIDFAEVLGGLGVEEKAPLPADHWSLRDITDIVTAHLPSSAYWTWRAMPWSDDKKKLGAWEKLGRVWQERGLLKTTFWLGGSVMLHGGHALKRWSETQPTSQEGACAGAQ